MSYEADGVTLRVELRLVPPAANEPISGSVRVASGREQRFRGWLELMAVLDSACADHRPAGQEDSQPIREGGTES